MWQAVKDNFMQFTEAFEGGGAIDYMFLDVMGRVGTAYGIDLDYNGGGRSPSLAISRSQGLPKALALDWVIRGTTKLASDAEITREWETIKAQKTGWASSGYRPYTKLQLTEKSMKARVFRLLTDNETTLKQHHIGSFRNFDSWPADAQLAVLGLSWNGVGHLTGNSHATLPNPKAFRDACQAEDFGLASDHCQMTNAIQGDNASIYRRSLAQKSLLLNASIVVREEILGNLQRSILYWPKLLAPRAVTTPPHPQLLARLRES